MSSPIHGGPISGTPPRGHVSLSWQVWAGSIYPIWTGNASVPQSLAVVKDNWNSPLSLLPLTCLFISFHPPFSSFPYYHPLFSPFPHHSFTRLPFRTSVPTRLIVEYPPATLMRHISVSELQQGFTTLQYNVMSFLCLINSRKQEYRSKKNKKTLLSYTHN